MKVSPHVFCFEIILRLYASSDGRRVSAYGLNDILQLK